MVLVSRTTKLYYKNVVMKPRRSFIKSRAEVDLSRDFKFHHSGNKLHCIPIMASNMDTIGTFEMAIALSQHEAMTCVHKYYPVEAWLEFSQDHPECMPYVCLTVGTRDTDFDKMSEILEAVPSIKYVLLDSLHTYSQLFVQLCRKIRASFPALTIIAGTVASREMVEELILYGGVDIVKVGLGMGSTQTTRKKTGIGYPSVSCIMECSDSAHGLGGHVIASGGCCCPGDVSKAFGAGADFVMLGGLLSGHDQCGGELILKDGKKYKLFYDMTSTTALKKHVGCVQFYRESEGRTVEVPYRGDVHPTFLDIVTGLRSTCTYLGCTKLKELSRRACFVPVSKGGQFRHSFQK